MKKLCLLLLLSLAASARAEDPAPHAPPKENKLAPAPETAQAHTAPQQDQKSTTQIELHAKKIPLHVEKPAPNETAHGHLKMDGILVELVKADNPLQLINPAAPERYGSAEDSVVRGLTSSKVSGLKFLELRF